MKLTLFLNTKKLQTVKESKSYKLEYTFGPL